MRSSDKLRGLASDKILIAAHRGVAGGNIPCNTLASYEVALQQGADILEGDVIKCADGELFMFHSGQERGHLGLTGVDIRTYTAEEIRKLRYVNQDLVPTQYGLSTLDEMLEHFKGRCYINLDRSWDIFEDVIAAVRRHGAEDQIILKSAPKMEYLKAVETLAPDIIYMPIINRRDECTSLIYSMDIDFAGAEVLFYEDDLTLAENDYVTSMHDADLLLWANAIVYNCQKQIAAGHNDDISVTGDPDAGWGWLRERGFDIIQTDWVMPLREYLVC